MTTLLFAFIVILGFAPYAAVLLFSLRCAARKLSLVNPVRRLFRYLVMRAKA
jgi:hypothetical protein